MEVLQNQLYHLPINQKDSLVAEEIKQGLFNRVIVVFDVSGSMISHRDTMEILINSALQAGQLVILFSSEAAFLEDMGEFSFGTYRDKWWRSTNYVAALDLLEQHSDSRVLFMTDGEPDSDAWRSRVAALHLRQRENGGSLCSLYLTNSATREHMLAVLRGLCSTGETPKIVNTENFRCTMLDDNANTIGSQVSADSVQVGSFKVSRGPPLGALVSTVSDVRQVAGIAAAFFFFLQQFAATLPVNAIVRAMNHWLGPHALKNAYRLAEMCDALRRVAAQCGVASVQQQNFDYLLSVAGVVSGVTFTVDATALQGLFDIGKIVAANSPMPAARAAARERQATKALQKTQSRLPETTRRAEALIAAAQPLLLAGFPYQGVSVHIDPIFKEQLAAVKQGGSGGTTSTAFQQSPASAALYVQETPRTISSLAEHRTGLGYAGTLLHIPDARLSAIMTELFPYVVSDGLVLSALAPYQLAEIVFSTLSAPLSRDNVWVMYLVLTALKHYTNETFAKSQPNPFNFNAAAYYNWADSFRGGLQIATPKLNLLAPLLASNGPFPRMESNGSVPAPEPVPVAVLVQCFMPVLKRALPSVDVLEGWLEIELTPAQVVDAIVKGISLSDIVQGGVMIIPLDESIVPDMRKELKKLPHSLPGIGCAGVTDEELAKVYSLLCAVLNGLSPAEVVCNAVCNVTFDQVWGGHFRAAFVEAAYRLLVPQWLGEPNTIEAADLMAKIKLCVSNGVLRFDLPAETKTSLLLSLLSDYITDVELPADLSALLLIARRGFDVRSAITNVVRSSQTSLRYNVVTQVVRFINPDFFDALMQRLQPETVDVVPVWPTNALCAYALSVDVSLFSAPEDGIGPVDYSGALNLFVYACSVVENERVGLLLASLDPAIQLRVAQSKPSVPLISAALQLQLVQFLRSGNQVLQSLPTLLSYDVIYEQFESELAGLLQVCGAPTPEQLSLADAIRQSGRDLLPSLRAVLGAGCYAAVTLTEAARETCRKFMDNVVLKTKKSKTQITVEDIEEYCVQRLTAQHRCLRENAWTFKELLDTRLAMEKALGPKFKVHNQAMMVLTECYWANDQWIVPTKFCM